MLSLGTPCAAVTKGPGYAGGGVTAGDGFWGVQVVGERRYPPWFGLYGEGGLFALTGGGSVYWGLGLGLRAAIPGRVSPYVGLGGHFGLVYGHAEFRTGEQPQSRIDLVFEGLSAYPEMGLQTRLTKGLLLNTAARYYSEPDRAGAGFWAAQVGLQWQVD